MSELGVVVMPRPRRREVATAPLPYSAGGPRRRRAVHPRARRVGPLDVLPEETVAAIRHLRKGEPANGNRTDAANRARLPLDHFLHALWLEGWPMHAIAAAYGTGRQAVHNRLYRARRFPLPEDAGLPPVPVWVGPCGPDHMVGSNVVGGLDGAVGCRACRRAARRRRLARAAAEHTR